MKPEPKTQLTFASIRFAGDRLEPDRLTNILDAVPSTAYRKGEVYKRGRGHEVRGRTGLWLLSSDGCLDSADLNEHLEYLLTIILPEHAKERLAQLHKLMREDGIEAYVASFWHGDYGAPAPSIRDDVRTRLDRFPTEIETAFATD
jgi:hypothetical protein